LCITISPKRSAAPFLLVGIRNPCLVAIVTRLGLKAKNERIPARSMVDFSSKTGIT